MKKINFSILVVGLCLASCNSSEEIDQQPEKSGENNGYAISMNIEQTDIEELDKIIQNDFATLKADFEKDQKSGDLTVQTLSTFSDKNISSILFEIESFGSEMPHPNTYFKSFNFNLNTNKLISFSDFFILKNPTDSSNFVDVLLENSTISKDDIISGNTNDLIKNSVFSIKQDSIIFSYGHNSISAWSNGVSSISVNKNKLTKYISNK